MIAFDQLQGGLCRLIKGPEEVGDGGCFPPLESCRKVTDMDKNSMLCHMFRLIQWIERLVYNREVTSLNSKHVPVISHVTC